MKHTDTMLRCLLDHGDGEGQCIRCSCGEWIRPSKWQAHIFPMTPEERAQVTFRYAAAEQGE